MMSLFSPFDLFFFYYTYIVLIFSFMFILNLYFLKNSLSIFMSDIFCTIEEFFYSLKPKMFNKMSFIISASLMFSLFILNFFSVFSFNFPFSSQFGGIFSLSLTIWSSFLLFSLKKNFQGFVFHSIPEGAPIYLVMFLFLIELISNFIRPLTLSVRLVANILAGHLLMILLSKLALFNLVGFGVYLILNIIEMFVAIIQAYIFTTMIILYLSEIH